MKYLKQWQRVNRLYKRFELINNRRKHSIESDNYEDDVYAFFIFYYHLRDWIKNDPKINIKQKIIDDFIHKNLDLKICGDICNGIKHLILDKPKVGKGATMKNKIIDLVLSSNTPQINIKYSIDIDGEIQDAFTIATNAINNWRNFLQKNQLSQK